MRNTTLGQLQSYADDLQTKELSPASIKRKLASIKSIFSFSHKIGYLAFDVGKPLKIPVCRDKLAERILSEEEVQAIIGSVKNKRKRRGRNPATNETLILPPIRVVTFNSSGRLKDRINNHKPDKAP